MIDGCRVVTGCRLVVHLWEVDDWCVCLAAEALSITHPLLKTRPLAQASRKSKGKAVRRAGTYLLTTPVISALTHTQWGIGYLLILNSSSLSKFIHTHILNSSSLSKFIHTHTLITITFQYYTENHLWIICSKEVFEVLMKKLNSSSSPSPPPPSPPLSSRPMPPLLCLSCGSELWIMHGHI